MRSARRLGGPHWPGGGGSFRSGVEGQCGQLAWLRPGGWGSIPVGVALFEWAWPRAAKALGASLQTSDFLQDLCTPQDLQLFGAPSGRRAPDADVHHVGFPHSSPWRCPALPPTPPFAVAGGTDEVGLRPRPPSPVGSQRREGARGNAAWSPFPQRVRLVHRHADSRVAGVPGVQAPGQREEMRPQTSPGPSGPPCGLDGHSQAGSEGRRPPKR